VTTAQTTADTAVDLDAEQATADLDAKQATADLDAKQATADLDAKQATDDLDAKQATDPGCRAMRADAKRNYDKILTAAREGFGETGASTSLEAIARRAGVGIGTLYRHFPTRQALLEAVYVGELQHLCSASAELMEMPAWDGFVSLMHRLVGYLATKKALASELLNYVDRDTAFFKICREDLFAAGEPILKRAQEAGEVRPDTNFTEIVQLVGGISKIEETAPGQREHILNIALDGLRCRS
jgi:AcrR family transcriptional regulator